MLSVKLKRVLELILAIASFYIKIQLPQIWFLLTKKDEAETSPNPKPQITNRQT